MTHPIDIAAKILGSEADLARALRVTKGAVNQWKEKGRRVPAEHCPEIERLTGGKVRCERLRPDINWGVLRKSDQTRTTSKAVKSPAPAASPYDDAQKRTIRALERSLGERPGRNEDRRISKKRER